jgi:hypothetical protein
MLQGRGWLPEVLPQVLSAKLKRNMGFNAGEEVPEPAVLIFL